MKAIRVLKLSSLFSVVILSLNSTTVNASSIEDAVKINNQSNTVHKFSELGKPKAIDQYWERMARCETNSNWQDKGRYAGGLGIMTNGKYGDYSMGTWERWGGEQFAKSPDKATKEEQILVANRISTQGWYQPDGKYKEPVGFNGWGCKKHIGSPILLSEPPDKYMFKKYKKNEHSNRVKVLQTLLGDVAVDGFYGPKTQESHKKYLDNLSKTFPVQESGIR